MSAVGEVTVSHSPVDAGGAGGGQLMESLQQLEVAAVEYARRVGYTACHDHSHNHGLDGRGHRGGSPSHPNRKYHG